MAIGNDYEDGYDTGYDYGGGHSGGHSSAPARQHFGGTSNFNTTLISEDGRFLGIKLSQDTASRLRTFKDAMLDWVRRKGEQHGVPLAENFARSVLSVEEKNIPKFGHHAGNVIGYSIILSDQIAGVGSNIYDSMQSVNELRTAVRPLQKTPGSAPLSGDNEVVASARNKINGIFWHKLARTLTGTIGTFPALMIKWHEQKVAGDERALSRKLASAKGDPEKIADALQERVTVAGVMHGDAADVSAGMSVMIDRERKAYQDRMRDFVRKNKTSIGREIETAMSAAHSNSEKNAVLNRFGISGVNHEHLGSQHYAEAAKARFVRREGAFDYEQTHYLGNDGRRGGYRTIRSELEGKIEALRKNQEKQLEQPKDPHNLGVIAAGAGASVVGEMATNALGGKKLEKYQQPVALDLILHLRRELEKAGDNPSEMVPGIRDSEQYARDVGYTRFVHQVFQEHQQDYNRPKIGSRFTEHFENARWDDEAIQALPDDQLSAYEFAVKTLAKRIKDGRMDAIALVTLVGDKQKKVVRDDGRSFGPRGTGKDEAAQKAAILKLIDEQTAMTHAAQSKSDVEVKEKLGEFVFGVEDLKQALTSPEMDPEQRSFLFTIFSNVVGDDKKLGKMLGMEEAQMQQLRAQAHAQFNLLLDGAVTVLADMIEHEPDKLAQHVKLTDNEKQLILGLAGRMREEGKDVADLTTGRDEIRALETVVANAGMALKDERDEKGEGFWQKLVKAAVKPTATIAAAGKMDSARGRLDRQRFEMGDDPDYLTRG